MDQPLRLIYILFYFAISLGGIYSDIKSRYAWWLTITDAVTSLVGFTGLLLYAFNFHTPFLKEAFFYLYPVFIVSSLFVDGIDLYDELKEGDKDNPDNKAQTLIAAGLALLFVELPAFVMLYVYTYLC